MDVTGVAIAAVVVGVIGLIIGLLLVMAAEKFKVEVDEKEILDKKLVKEIQSFRETFNENVMITGGIFKTRYKLINKDSLILTSRNINEAAFKKINEFNNV